MALAAASPSPAAPAEAATSQEAVYGFGCVQQDGNYLVGLGLIPRPSFDLALNPMSVPPLKGSGLRPIAQLSGPVGGVSVSHRCTSIATRLTNLALATGTASPVGILTLTQFLQAGIVAGQPVIAIGQLALPDVLATLPLGTDPQQALNRVTQRIQQVAAAPAIAEVLLREGLVEFVEIEIP
ncbi:hypothetical protein [Aphanothece microscopica]